MAASSRSDLSRQDRRGPAHAHRGERLQKVLAAAGLGSRRKCEAYILDGRVEVEGRVVTQLGLRVDPRSDDIRVDGAALPKPKRIYFLVNKPPGVVSTNRDPGGRPRVIDLIFSDQRLFPVGRLDKSSEGLLLVTNDGGLANRLAHPRYGVPKTYLVQVAGRPPQEKLAKLRRGVHLAEGVARVASLKVKRRRLHSTDLEIVLNEGRNREIRRVLARIGHKVLRLKRIALGPLRLGDLPSGAYRRLTRKEVRELERFATRAQQSPRAASGHELQGAIDAAPRRGGKMNQRPKRTRRR
jgi:23S rRNA pseudouridine2605 synthase